MQKFRFNKDSVREEVAQWLRAGLSAVVLTIYTSIPLLALSLLYLFFWPDQMRELRGSPDVAFVIFFFFIDSTRDSVRSLMFRTNGADIEGVEFIVILASLLLFAAISTLIVSVMLAHGAIQHPSFSNETWANWQIFLLKLGVCYSWFTKVRAIYHERKKHQKTKATQ